MTKAWAINAGKAPTPVGTATIAAATDLLTITAHGLSDGDRIAVDTLTGGAVSVLVEDEVLYVRDATANTFAVTRTLHGPAVEFSSDGGAEVHRWTPAHTAPELRRIQAMFLMPGSGDRFGARAGVRPTGQTIVEVSGQTWIQRDVTAVVYPGLTSQSGPYVAEKAEENGTFDPADGTNPRIDALDLQVRDDDEDASTFRDLRVAYKAGTPAGSPVEPTLTANSLRIGTFDVPAGGTPGPSVRTQAQFAVATGGVLPARTLTELPTTGRYEGMAAYRTDEDTLVIWDGAAWQIIATPQVPQAVQFTGSGSFVKGDFPWGRYIVAEVQGGGGGGGGSPSTGAGVGMAGGGGGGGGYARKVIAFSALSASETVTVGAAGAGAPAGSNPGGTGGTSSFGAHCSGTGGGGGGTGSATASTITDGGEGGTGSGGDINVAGSDGLGGHVPSANSGDVMGGYGGSSHLGGSESPSGVDSGAAGTAGKAFGGGGSGGYNTESQGSNRGGGAGGPGVVLVTVY